MFISLLYVQKLKCKFGHLKSTPSLLFRLPIVDQCLERSVKFSHRIDKRIYQVFGLGGTWTKTLRLLYNTTSCSYVTGDLVPVSGTAPPPHRFFCCTYIIYKKTTSTSQTMVCKQFLSKLSLLEKPKLCINTMESTDTASIQWVIIYTIYQVIVALDV